MTSSFTMFQSSLSPKGERYPEIKPMHSCEQVSILALPEVSFFTIIDPPGFQTH